MKRSNGFSLLQTGRNDGLALFVAAHVNSFCVLYKIQNASKGVSLRLEGGWIGGKVG